jgi:hypothetical protein
VSLWSVVSVVTGIGFQAEDPLAELIVVARLEAADDAIDLLRFGERADSEQGHFVLG